MNLRSINKRLGLRDLRKSRGNIYFKEYYRRDYKRILRELYIRI